VATPEFDTACVFPQTWVPYAGSAMGSRPCKSPFLYIDNAGRLRGGRPLPPTVQALRVNPLIASDHRLPISRLAHQRHWRRFGPCQLWRGFGLNELPQRFGQG